MAIRGFLRLSDSGRANGHPRDARTRFLTIAAIFILVIMLLAALLQVWRETSFADQSTRTQMKARAAYLEGQIDAGVHLTAQLADRVTDALDDLKSGGVCVAADGPAGAAARHLDGDVAFWPDPQVNCAIPEEQLQAIASEIVVLGEAAREIGVERLSALTPYGVLAWPVEAAQISTPPARAAQGAAILSKTADGEWLAVHANEAGTGQVVSWVERKRGRDKSEILVTADFPASWFWQFTLPFEGATNEVMVLARDGTILARGNSGTDSPAAENVSAALGKRVAEGNARAAPKLDMEGVAKAGDQTASWQGYRIAASMMGDQPLLIASFIRGPDFVAFIAERNAVILGAIVLLAALTIVGYLAIRVIVLAPARRAEVALQQISDRLHAIFATVPVGICLIEDDRRITSANDRFAELVDLGGMAPAPESERDPRIGWLLGSADASGEERIIKSAAGRSLLVRSAPVNGGDQRVATVTDITERVQIEAELATARDAAESASRSKAEFLAAMSYEIRTPMNGVIGMVDLLSQTSLAAAQRRSLRTIREFAYALLRIINDILDFSKIEAGRLEIESLETSLAETVEGAVATLAIAASTNRLRILTFIDPSLPRLVRGDPLRIRQILMNLCGNAIKFSKDGEVVVRADPEPSKPGHIQFTVIDHGIGISEENQKKLFREFSQAESSTTRRFGGTGLGLAICKRLTEMMNGTIHVSSVVDLGTRFTVSLPLPTASNGASEESQLDFADCAIVLVGRSADERKICRSYLEFWRASVREVDQLDNVIEQTRKVLGAGRAMPLVVFLSDLQASEVQGAMSALKELGGNIHFVAARNPNADASSLTGSDSLVVVDAQPLRRAAFINAVAVGLGLASPEVPDTENDDVIPDRPALSAADAERRGQLILVAEDNPTNQEVIGGQLAKLGFACEIVDDGKQAYESWRSGRFAVVLTDCHMPLMDGFDLTRKIREQEAAHGAGRTPIIAITANAMKGEAERCLASGMDAYLAKPIELKRLNAALGKWMPKARQEPNSGEQEGGGTPATDAEGVEPAVLDLTLLRETFADEEAKIEGLLKRFLVIGKEIIGEIESNVERRDTQAVGDSSHKLKSSALTTGAYALAESCRALEEAARQTNWEEIAVMRKTLAPELDRVAAAIAAR